MGLPAKPSLTIQNLAALLIVVLRQDGCPIGMIMLFLATKFKVSHRQGLFTPHTSLVHSVPGTVSAAL